MSTLSIFVCCQQRHNKHFDVEVEPEVDLEPSSEQDLQSPYRKKQHSFRQTSRSNISLDLKESRMEFNVGKNAKQLPDKQSQQQEQSQQNNGLYEQDDFSIRSISQKRTKPKSNNATSADHWSKFTQPVQYSVKQNNTVLYDLQRQQQHSGTIKQNTRIHHKSLSNRILSLKRENKTTQTLSIVVGGFVVCWLPFFVCYLIAPFVPVSKTLSTVLTWLGWLNRWDLSKTFIIVVSILMKCDTNFFSSTAEWTHSSMRFIVLIFVQPFGDSLFDDFLKAQQKLRTQVMWCQSSDNFLSLSLFASRCCFHSSARFCLLNCNGDGNQLCVCVFFFLVRLLTHRVNY